MIDLFKVFMSPSVGEKVNKTLYSGFIGEGPKSKEFEESLSRYFNNDTLFLVNSGTSALHLSYLLTDIKGPVLVSPLTCAATITSILQAGHTFKWVDIDPDTLNVNLDYLKSVSCSNTIAIVHWGGSANDLDSIEGFNIIEDCAHAFGSKYKDKLIGNHGNICAFSFQAIKNLTTGDGGMVITNNPNKCKKGKLLRWYGIDRNINDREVVVPGYKYHMNDISATIGIENLKEIDKMLSIQRDNARFYDLNLNIDKIKRNEGSSCWLYTIKVKNKKDFEKAMLSRGIHTGLHHIRNDYNKCWKDLRINLPCLDSVYEELTNIPVGWWITKEDREYIVDCIKDGW